ncbi:MAG: phosphatase PAP2 family protein [Deltaproteobacteria bacterium]|jgi:lipid A 4'-phosphatase
MAAASPTSGKTCRLLRPEGACRRHWLPELLVLLAIVVFSTALFWLTSLDMAVAGLFYQSQGGIWTQETPFLVTFLNGIDVWLTSIFLTGAVGVLLVSLLSARARRLRIYAFLCLASLAVGPGLLVNGVFKGHWGRPRPNQTLEFGGTETYLPPLVKGDFPDGHSFPSGHASVAFVFVVLWFIWRRRHPTLAWTALLGSLLLGLIVGYARMAVGAHYLSDILWSFIITFLVSHFLYYFIFRIQVWEGRTLEKSQTFSSGRKRMPVSE